MLEFFYEKIIRADSIPQNLRDITERCIILSEGKNKERLQLEKDQMQSTETNQSVYSHTTLNAPGLI